MSGSGRMVVQLTTDFLVGGSNPSKVHTRPGVRVYPHSHGIHTFCFWDTHRIHTRQPWDTHVIHANHEKKKERNLGHPPQDACYGNMHPVPK